MAFLQPETRDARRAFYCELCQKGYASQTLLDGHESSYDHQHRKRARDLKHLSKNPSAAKDRSNESAELRTVALPSVDGTAAKAKNKKTFASAAAAAATPSRADVAAVTAAGGKAGAKPAEVADGGDDEDDEEDDSNDEIEPMGPPPPWAVRAGWADDMYDPAFPTEYIDVEVRDGQIVPTGKPVTWPDEWK